jgi:hypothetical protein
MFHDWNLTNYATIFDRPCGLVLATDPEVRLRFTALPDFPSSGSGTGTTQPPEYN